MLDTRNATDFGHNKGAFLQPFLKKKLRTNTPNNPQASKNTLNEIQNPQHEFTTIYLVTIQYPLATTLTINHIISRHNVYLSPKTTPTQHTLNVMYSLFLLPFQVDANAIFVDYSGISLEGVYYQSASDIRVAARYVAR